MIKDNYKQISFKEDIKNIIDKKNILKKIENIIHLISQIKNNY